MADGSAEGKDIEIVTVLIEAWTWAFKHLFSLFRYSWLSIAILVALMMAMVFGMFAIFQQTGMTEGSFWSNPSEFDFGRFMDLQKQYMVPLFVAGLGINLIFSVISAVPVRAATSRALGEKPRIFLYFFNFRIGSEELRIGLLSFLVGMVLLAPSSIFSIMYYDEYLAMALEAFDAVSSKSNPQDMMRMNLMSMRLNSISMGISLLSALIMAYFYGRVIPAIPIIVRGGKGLGIRQALRLTKGYGGSMFGLAFGFFVAAMVSYIGLMIAAAVVLTLVMLIGVAVESPVVLVVALGLYVFLWLLFLAFLFGFGQRFKVTTYEWLRERQGEPA